MRQREDSRASLREAKRPTISGESWLAAPMAWISSAARLPRRPAVVGTPSRTKV